MLTKEIQEDIVEWQKTTGITTMRAIGMREDSFVLDVGCGDGIFTIAEGYACGKGLVFGIDTDSETLAICKERVKEAGLHNVHILCHDIFQVISNGEYGMNVITMNDLIHEFDDIPRLINQLKSLLEEDGILAITPFHMSESEIENMIQEIISCDMRLDHVVENGGIHFGKVKHMNGAWQRLADFERGNIYCFKKKQ